MRTETREYQIYNINELSTASQDKAHQEWLVSKEYTYSDYNRATLSAFETAFNVKATNWSYDSYSYSYRFTTELSADIEELSGTRLATYIINNYWDTIFKCKSYWMNGKSRKSKVFYEVDCVLTGYCADCSILEPIYRFLEQPNEHTTYKGLINKCLDNFFKFCRDDVESTETLDYFKEESEANEWEYIEVV
ncbi:MAG: hypothetical protein R3Y04_09720 [Rikenellaceae bacterium]